MKNLVKPARIEYDFCYLQYNFGNKAEVRMSKNGNVLNREISFYSSELEQLVKKSAQESLSGVVNPEKILRISPNYIKIFETPNSEYEIHILLENGKALKHRGWCEIGPVLERSVANKINDYFNYKREGK
jgi:hypothetical protein